jgi:small subunit ribosomal protein S20
VEQLIEQKEVQAAQEALRIATKKLDKAVSKGLIHKNKAARHKSNLTKKFNQITQETSA